MFLSNQNKIFRADPRADPNYIKEMQINYESSVMLRQKISCRNKSRPNDMFV